MPEQEFFLTISTGGRDLHRLVQEELRDLLDAREIQRFGQARFFFRADVAPGGAHEGSAEAARSAAGFGPERFEELRAPEKLYAVVHRQPPSELVPLLGSLSGSEAEEALAAHVAASPGWSAALATWRRFARRAAAAAAVAATDGGDDTAVAATDGGDDAAVTAADGGDDAAEDGNRVVIDSLPRTFRVTGKRAGKQMAHLSSNGISELVGEAVAERLGWQVALRGFDVEVVINLNDEMLLVALPLLERGSARQAFFALPGLSQPVAWAMARSADIAEGELVVDPMCGSGIVLLEAAQCWSGARYLGFDNDASQLARAASNLALLQGRARAAVSLARGNAARLPLSDGSCDAVLCDLPFGKQFGSEEENETLYPAVVAEFRRILRPHSGRAVLLTNQANSKRLADAFLAAPEAWTVTCRRRLTLGFMEAVLFLATAAPSGGAGLPPESMRLPWEDGRGRAKWSSFKAMARQPLQPVMLAQRAAAGVS